MYIVKLNTVYCKYAKCRMPNKISKYIIFVGEKEIKQTHWNKYKHQVDKKEQKYYPVSEYSQDIFQLWKEEDDLKRNK